MTVRASGPRDTMWYAKCRRCRWRTGRTIIRADAASAMRLHLQSMDHKAALKSGRLQAVGCGCPLQHTRQHGAPGGPGRPTHDVLLRALKHACPKCHAKPMENCRTVRLVLARKPAPGTLVEFEPGRKLRPSGMHRARKALASWHA